MTKIECLKQIKKKNLLTFLIKLSWDHQFIKLWKFDNILFFTDYLFTVWNFILYFYKQPVILKFIEKSEFYSHGCRNSHICRTNFLWISDEWGWTARNSIARQSFARHFWQQINCSIQNLSTAQKLSSSWHFFLVWHINWKSQFFTYRNGQ